MRLFDRTLLALPLYEDRHRALADDVESAADGYARTIAEWPDLDPRELGRRLVGLLGRDGWFAHAVPAAGAPDLRAVSLLREGFAQVHDLLDFAFSIQALSSTPLALRGTDEQRAHLLAPAVTGQRIGSFAISEPDVGSDAASVRVSATLDGADYRLDGIKTWIANGDIADLHTVLVRTGEGPGALGLTMLLVPADAPGLIVEPIDVIAPRAFASLVFDGCRVPATNVLGRPGRGFPIAMEVLDRYRLTVGAAAVGFARRALTAGVVFAKGRQVKGGTLFNQQLTQAKLADAAVALSASALLVARAAYEVDTGARGFAKHASIAKLHATEAAQRIVDDVVQLHGAAGLVQGSVPEHLYREVRSLTIYEGTSEVQRMIIAESLRRQG